MIDHDTCAWVVWEMKNGRTQASIARELDVVASHVAASLIKFCRQWSTDITYIYGERRREIEEAALWAFWRHRGTEWFPDKPAVLDGLVAADKEVATARHEHAFLLRCEGLKLREVGAHLGVTRERARSMILKFSRRVNHTMRRTRCRIWIEVMEAS